MKKLVFMACFMTIASFMACGNKTEKSVSTIDSDSVVVDTVVVDSLDSVIVG